ncbi:MAG: hypothetical protein ACYCYK_03270 [Candidatus Dormibacteria bacterium]
MSPTNGRLLDGMGPHMAPARGIFLSGHTGLPRATAPPGRRRSRRGFLKRRNAGPQDTWRNLRNELQRLHVGTFQGSAGRCLQRTEITSRQAEVLKALEIPEPPRFLALGANPRPAA